MVDAKEKAGKPVKDKPATDKKAGADVVKKGVAARQQSAAVNKMVRK